MEFAHTSVLLEETIEGLHIRPDGVYVDGTLGGAGHSYEICRRLSGAGRLIGIDQDGDAIEAAKERLREYEDRVTVVRSNYQDMPAVHFVDDGTDTGPILLQKSVDVQPDDTPKSLQQRVMEEAEWILLPKAIDLIAAGRVEVVDGKAVIR